MDDDDDVARPHRSSGASLILELARGARTEMDDAALRRRRPSGSNRAKAAVLTSALKKRGAVSSPEVAAAFARVDRSVFLPASSEHLAWDDDPLRAWDDDAQCIVHLSAPSIYATALEALELSRSRAEGEGALSFLNIGSGSGYLSALAATILGPRSVHHCVEISAPLAARCRSTFEELSREGFGSEWSDDDTDVINGKSVSRINFGAVPELRHANVHVASCFDLALETSMKFDRIYVGAGARASDARFLSKLLKPGGIMVGPFKRDVDRAARHSDFGAQSLLKATRAYNDDDREACFEVDELMPVQFAPLSRQGIAVDGRLVDADFRGLLDRDSNRRAVATPARDENRQPRNDDDQRDDETDAAAVSSSSSTLARDANEDAPGGRVSCKHVRDPTLRSFALRGPTWGHDSTELFAPCFVEAIESIRKAVASRKRQDAFAHVPWHVWEDKVWPLLAHDDILFVAEVVKAPLKRRGDVGADLSPKRRLFTPADRRLGGATVAAARRSLAIARAVARWTLARLASDMTRDPESSQTSQA